MARILCVGHAVEDFVFSVDTLPNAARKYQSIAFERVGGGPAANAAVAISRLGGTSLLAARIGDDAVGRSIIDDLISEGVDCARVRRFEGVASSMSAVFIDKSGERMIVNHRPATLAPDPDWLIKVFPDNVDAVLADTRWPEGAKAALALAKSRGGLAILDADLPVPDDEELLQAATHVAFSADGLKDFAAIKDLDRALLAVSRKTDAWCCVTAGQDGVLITDGKAVKTIPAYAVTAIDTLGAGDIWHGGFALGLAEGMGGDKAVQFANACAAVKVTRNGGRKGAPSRRDVLSLMNE